MFRALAILVVLLVAGIAVLVLVDRNVTAPRRRARKIEELEAENARLDELLARGREEGRRE